MPTDCLRWLVDYDRVLQFDANDNLRAARDEEEGDSDDDAETLEFRRQEAGAYTQQRLAVVMVVTAAHSSAVAKRVAEKLHQVCVCVYAPFVLARKSLMYSTIQHQLRVLAAEHSSALQAA